jgi:hypothetical protein
MTVIDLKSIVYYGHSVLSRITGVANEYWKNHFLPNHGLRTHA